MNAPPSPPCDPATGSADAAAAEGAAPGKTLTPAAARALQEAAARRAAEAAEASPTAPEQGGPAGAEPTRFGDWERKGIAYDF
jgi:hypothetical protein